MLVELEQSRTTVVEPVCGSAQLCGGPPHNPHGGRGWGPDAHSPALLQIQHHHPPHCQRHEQAAVSLFQLRQKKLEILPRTQRSTETAPHLRPIRIMKTINIVQSAVANSKSAPPAKVLLRGIFWQ